MLSVKEKRNKEVTTSGVDLERQIMFFYMWRQERERYPAQG